MRKNIISIDWWLLAPVVVLFFISLTTLFSLNPVFFRSQLIYWIVGMIFFLVFASIDTERLKQFALPLYFFSLITLGIVLLIGIESHGAVRWIAVFGGSIQISEICKPLLIISLASFLSQRQNTQGKNLFVIFLLLLPVVTLIYLQPDLGNAIIYVLTVVFVLLIYGFRLRYFFVGILSLLIFLPFFWAALRDYQRQRLMSFFHPTSNQHGASYNAVQAIIAVGSGMFMGRGLSEGTQSILRFLPERQTDFIFASMTEELGFVGALIVLLAFTILLYRIYFIYRMSDDIYAKMIAVAVFAFFLIHVFLNIGMNIGLAPIVGVTLPFVSFGGSSLLANCLMLGLVTSVSKTLTRSKVLEIR